MCRRSGRLALAGRAGWCKLSACNHDKRAPAYQLSVPARFLVIEDGTLFYFLSLAPWFRAERRAGGSESEARTILPHHDHPGGGCRGRQHPTDAVGGDVEQRFRRASQRRLLPDVCHHVRERVTRANACDCAELPPVLGIPVEDRSETPDKALPLQRLRQPPTRAGPVEQH